LNLELLSRIGVVSTLLAEVDAEIAELG